MIKWEATADCRSDQLLLQGGQGLMHDNGADDQQSIH